jgi:hypothetical protein
MVPFPTNQVWDRRAAFSSRGYTQNLCATSHRMYYYGLGQQYRQLEYMRMRAVRDRGMDLLGDSEIDSAKPLTGR